MYAKNSLYPAISQCATAAMKSINRKNLISTDMANAKSAQPLFQKTGHIATLAGRNCRIKADLPSLVNLSAAC